jgi:hypothetical protein
MEVAALQQPSHNVQSSNGLNAHSNAMEASMDIDMDIDLVLPEPEDIKPVSPNHQLVLPLTSF